MKKIQFKPIGIIHSPYNTAIGMPIQSKGANGISGTIELFPEYIEGLKDLEEFSHIILLYHFHLYNSYSLLVKPFMDEKKHGVFSTRAPKRPNSIGFSVVRLVEIDGNILHLQDIDVVDGTPLLDIKPYVPEFDVKKVERLGWLSPVVKGIQKVKADERFNGNQP